MYAQSRQFHHMDRQSQHNLLELHIESSSTCQDMVFFNSGYCENDSYPKHSKDPHT